MVVTILLPHFRTGKMTAYCISQLLAHKGKHKVKIIVIDNSQGEGLEYLAPFRKKIKLLTPPPERMQSHGIAFDFAMPYVETEYFITVESDSFPTQDWLDYYEALGDVDAAGSILQLSGGKYLHPAGAMYKTALWHEASKVKYPYTYFPNMSDKGDRANFAYHIMVPNSYVEAFAQDPEFQGIKRHHSYREMNMAQVLGEAERYLPTTGVFHNGMGMRQESVNTYGKRDFSDSEFILPYEGTEIIHRVGYEPGQWFSYWMAATGKNIIPIPTEVKWMPGRENQQQEYTLMENGFTHLWGVSAYHGANIPELRDVVDFKEKQMEDLWRSISISQ